MPELAAFNLGNMRVETGGGAVQLLIDIGNNDTIRVHMRPDDAARLSMALDDAVVDLADEADADG